MTKKLAKPDFSLSPLLWLAGSFAAGVTFSSVIGMPVFVLIAAVVFAAAFSHIFRRRSFAVFFLLGSFLFLGAACFQIEKAGVATDRLRSLYDNGGLISGDPIEIEGRVAGSPEPAPDGYFIFVQSERAYVGGIEKSATGRVRIFVPLQNDRSKAEFDDLGLRHGSLVRAACLLEREDKYLNPGVYPRKQLLDRQGIDATANLKSPLLIEMVGKESFADRLPGAVFELRGSLIRKFREMFSAQTAGVLIASMLGNKYFLDKRTADVFREGGTFHVLVISGLHVTFLGGLILLFMRRFTARRWVQAAVTLAFLWCYGIAVGADVPVVRACVMFTILMVGYAEFRSSNLFNSLGVSVLVLLAWRPSDLFDPSFQLTFASVAAIIAIGLPLLSKLKAIGTWMPTAEHPFPSTAPNWLKRFCETIYWRDASWEIQRGRQIWSAEIKKSPFISRLGEFGMHPTTVFLFEGVIISLAVQICLLPLLVYYFHRFPAASIPLNLWVGGVLAAESISAFVAAGISTISETLAFPFVVVTEFFNWLIVTLPSFLAGRFSGTRIPIYSGALRPIYLIYFIPLILLITHLKRWDPFAFPKSKPRRHHFLLGIGSLSTLVLLAALILFHPYSAPSADGRLHFDFLDVGQGDAALVTFPNGKTMLIDAGGKLNYRDSDEDDEPFEPDVPRIGEAVVSEFLWERGISRIDMIVATHADADHIQGLSDVVRNFAVGDAYFGRIGSDPELTPLLRELEAHEIERSIVHAGEALDIGGVNVEVLNPSDDSGTANNGSVVLKFTLGETSFLFTGDIERDAEEMLLRAGGRLHADVIKVPHHGSRSSSTAAFVEAVRPRYAIISVGRRSVFGHPHKEVVERWEAAGAEVLTTGQRGTISLTSDGKTIGMERWR